jgi:hypothetical protein
MSNYGWFILGFFLGFILASFLTNRWAREKERHCERLEKELKAIRHAYRIASHSDARSGRLHPKDLDVNNVLPKELQGFDDYD